MAIEICMPRLSDTMAEGTLLEWLVAVGDIIESGQVIAVIETDNVPLDLQAAESGEITALHIEAGEKISVGAKLATLSLTSGTASLEKASVPPQAVSSAAQQLAAEVAIDLKSIQGSGPDGRIVLVDIERANSSPESAAAGVDTDACSSGKSIKIRRLIARKMEEAWRTIPHFYVTMPVDMTDVIRFRKDLAVTINDFVLAATARALAEHPWVNATWNGEQGVALPDINLSIAVATDRGLYNPVIHNCEKLSLKQISAKSRELGDKAANQGRLKPEEVEGGTFTITNMGMLGVESFGAIITPPQAAVLSVGTVKGEIVVDEQGEPAVAPVMRLTLSADHRVLDGADAAEFLDTIKSYLEAPIMLVSE